MEPDFGDVQPAGITKQQKMMLGVLAGSTVLVMVLAVATRGRRRAVVEQYVDPNATDWETSVKHFARAVEVRFQGYEQRLTALEDAAGIAGPPPAKMVSSFPDPGGNGKLADFGPPTSVAQSAPTPQDTNPPPGPATVSMP